MRANTARRFSPSMPHAGSLAAAMARSMAKGRGSGSSPRSWRPAADLPCPANRPRTGVWSIGERSTCSRARKHDDSWQSARRSRRTAERAANGRDLQEAPRDRGRIPRQARAIRNPARRTARAAGHKVKPPAAPRSSRRAPDGCPQRRRAAPVRRDRECRDRVRRRWRGCSGATLPDWRGNDRCCRPAPPAGSRRSRSRRRTSEPAGHHRCRAHASRSSRRRRPARRGLRHPSPDSAAADRSGSSSRYRTCTAVAPATRPLAARPPHTSHHRFAQRAGRAH